MELLTLRLRGDVGWCCLVALDCRLSPPVEPPLTLPPVPPAFLPLASCFSILSMARSIASNFRSSLDLGLSFLVAGVDVGVDAVDVLESSSLLPSCAEVLLMLLVGVVAFAGVLRFAGVACTLLLLLLILLLLLVLLMFIVCTVADLMGDFVGDTIG